MAPLLDMCNTGFYWLKQEEAELKDRAKQKEEQGYTSRLKQGKKQATAAVSVATAGLLKEFCGRPYDQSIPAMPTAVLGLMGLCVFQDPLRVPRRPSSKRTVQTSGAGR